RLEVPFAVILGEDEIRRGAVALKNLDSGEQCAVSVEAAAEIILSELARRNSGSVIKEKNI
ncbi:MAG: His/Gly/Thr/Pro-type tRNA ligase C-terminal domain-containing protein, partial [Firmicutes bacterium]|nr:His/Gly/Thr/Pro-type tRNA ligase C-terminal domain-containing protein [Bacillota bacterium]